MKNILNKAARRLLFVCAFMFALQAYAQQININVKNSTLESVLKTITQQTGYRFTYTDAINAQKTMVSVDVNNTAPLEFFKTFFGNYGISYKVSNKLVSLSPLKQESVKKRTVKGKVTDDNGATIPGAAVRNATTGTITVSDMDGNFSIAASEGDKLQFTAIGMADFSTTVGKNDIVNAVLPLDIIALDDVVVTGYQTISKERATGSYSTVSANVISQKPTANISSVLNGMVPGLSVASNAVDGQTRFIIRGQGTLQSSQIDKDPLIVVDGFPINGFSTDNDNPFTNIKDPFSTINPNDVENITVLKDAAATSIYGARAANGVIVITTKKGKAGEKMQISADAYFSVGQKADVEYYFNMASAENQFRYLELMQNYEPIDLGYYNPYTTKWKKMYMSDAYSMLWEKDSRGTLSDSDYQARKAELLNYAEQQLWKKDIEKHILQNTIKQNYNLALRGATEKINYAFSASYNKEDGYSIGNANRRIIINMGAVTKLTKNLSFNININTTFAKRDDNGVSLGSLKAIMSPWSRLTDDNGNFIHVPASNTVYYPILMSEYEGKTPASWLYNPVTDRQYQNFTSNNMNYRIQGGFDYKTSWGLNLSAKGQYEYQMFDIKRMYDAESYYVRDMYNTYSKYNAASGKYESFFPAGGIFTDSGDKYESYNLRGQADYHKKIGKHDIVALAGTEIISATTNNIPSITRYGFNKNTYSVLSTPDYVTMYEDIFGDYWYMPYSELGSLSLYEERFFSIYANLGYTFNDKYSITASFRTDATNYQTKETREKFSPFWSVGGSWMVTKEKFMEQATWVDMLKLRASIGVAGVSAGKKGNSTVTTVETNPGDITYTNNQPYSTISMRGNPTLTWEKSRTLNIGVDFSLFENKLYGNIDYYNKLSYDVLAAATVPVISQGVNKTVYNNAKIQNNGIEVSLGTNINIAKDFIWNGQLNLAYNNNLVKEYNVTSSSPTMINVDFLQGYPLNTILVLKPKGYTADGQIILQGKDGSEEIIKDNKTSHVGDQIERQNGKTVDDLNYTYFLGSYTPKYELGFSNRFTYKGLTLSFMITGRFDYWVNANNRFDASQSTDAANMGKHLDGSFEVYDQGYENQTEYSYFPLYSDANKNHFNASWAYMRMDNSQQMFDTQYKRGDHIRLQEIYLGYNLPKRILSKTKIFEGVNIYAQATNLGIIWSSCKDFDPEYTWGTLKPMTTFTFGLKLNFKY